MKVTLPKTLLSAVALAMRLALCPAQETQPGQPTPPPAAAGSVSASQGQAPQTAPNSSVVQQPATQTSAKVPATAPSVQIKNAAQLNGNERRKASKLYLAGTKLYEKGQFEAALRNYQEAAALDPTNQDYRLAADVARSHAVTALLQTAAQARTRGDVAAARAALSHAFQLDPQSEQLEQHRGELEAEASSNELEQEDRTSAGLGGMETVEHASGVHSFHLRSSQRQVIQDVFRAYGVEATIDQGLRAASVRFDIDDAGFAQAARALSLATRSFYVPIDAHRVLVAQDTRENRRQYTRNGEVTVYLPGMTATEMTDMGNLAKNVFEVSQSAVNPTAGTLTLRAPASQLNAFNATYRSLMDGRSQIVLDVKLIQLAHNNARSTGVQLPQQFSVFNVYTQEQAILNANQGLIQQIIAAGLAAPGDTLAILAILLASGQVSSPILENGFALFGGGITLSGLTISPLTVNFNLNSSDSRELDQLQLRLADGEEGTLKSGTRYPIMTSTYSNLGAFGSGIQGLNSPGTSSNLNSLVGSLPNASGTIPMVEYQDLGLTLKTTPSIMRSGEVALKIDLKFNALAGSSVNGVPVLANRAWSGVVTVGQNEAVVVASEMDRQETHAVSGTPGLSEIPGLNNITTKTAHKDTTTLLVVMTPRVVRSPRQGDHTPMVRIDANVQTR